MLERLFASWIIWLWLYSLTRSLTHRGYQRQCRGGLANHQIAGPHWSGREIGQRRWLWSQKPSRCSSEVANNWHLHISAADTLVIWVQHTHTRMCLCISVCLCLSVALPPSASSLPPSLVNSSLNWRRWIVTQKRKPDFSVARIKLMRLIQRTKPKKFCNSNEKSWCGFYKAEICLCFDVA